MLIDKEKLKKYIQICLILLSIFLIYYFLNQNFGFAIQCPFYALTGLYCPGCGITRCLFALLKLNFKEAFYFNQLVFILLPFFGLYICYKAYVALFQKENKVKKYMPNYVLYVLLGITILFGILRNLPGFEILRPL